MPPNGRKPKRERKRKQKQPCKRKHEYPLSEEYYHDWGATDRGAKKSTLTPNVGTFGPIIKYVLSGNIKP